MVGNFCSDDFWNLNKTWYTDKPDFTSCFQDIALDLAPSTLFSILGLFYLRFASRRRSALRLPWTWRLVVKFVLCVYLLIISILWFGVHLFDKHLGGCDGVPISTLIASLARSFTFIVIIALMHKHRSNGITTSTALSVFWICIACCGAVMQRSIIVHANSRVSRTDVNFVLNLLYYPIIYLELILSFFADAKSSTEKRGSPLEEVPFLSSIFYFWFNKTIYKSLRRLLTVHDFLPLAHKLQTSYVHSVFSKNWNFNPSDPQKLSLAWALLKSFWPWLLAALIFDMCYVICLLMPPLILDKILEYVEDDQHLWRLYFFCCTIFIVNFMEKLLINIFNMYLTMAGAQVKSVLISAVFRKNLLIANSSRKDFSSGSIVNLISVDVHRISSFAKFTTSLISTPFRIALIIFFMWKYLGVACLAGLAAVGLLFPISFCISAFTEKYTEKQMTVKDMRLKCVNEILTGIKILKFYAWEVPFTSNILKTREEEIRLIRFTQFCYAITSFVYECAPIMVSVVTFTTFILMDSRNILDPTRAFVSLNLLYQLRNALFLLPFSLSELIQTKTSVDRIRKFLITEEMDPSIVGSCSKENDAVTFKEANFFWSKDADFSLQDISLNIPVGKLVAIIGPVGSGKSSLLSAILGDLNKSLGSIDVKGTLAYVPQEAWILNRTVRNNILLERAAIDQKYNVILDCCCLRPDLEMLPGMDETEIGEKGINLSGGQKQRVSVARALFQNRDIYLLDDPLSAVDAHVRKALFDDVIGNSGLLKDKTRLLVTHDISVLPHVDLIVRMDGGKILEMGTYQELLNGIGDFQDFINYHSGLNAQTSCDNSEMIPSTETTSLLHGRRISEDCVKPSQCKENTLMDGNNLIEDEKMEEGGVKKGIYLNFAKKIGWLCCTCAVLGFAGYATLEPVCTVWVAKWSEDPTLDGVQDYPLVTWRLSVYAGLGFVQVALLIFGIIWLVYGVTKAAKTYHNQMLESVLKTPMSFFDVTPMGRILNRFSTDMDDIDNEIIYRLDIWLKCVFNFLATSILIGINMPLFFAFIVPLAAAYYTFLKLHLNTSRQIRRLESTTLSPIYSHLLESIHGALSIKAFQVQREFIKKLEVYVDAHTACYFNTQACNRWLHFWQDLISCLMVFTSAWLAIDNRHDLGISGVGMILTFALAVTDALTWFVQTNYELENISVATERIDEYCHLQSEAPMYKTDRDPGVSWPEKGAIVFDNYSTRYRENLDLVLRDVTLNVLPNEKVGIVGRTGAGKSSVTLALFRIIEPAQGTILIDNVDISNIGLHALRSKLTIIPQDPVLFTGTLRFNLDANDEYVTEDIWTSLSNAHLKEFVSNLPGGLEHDIEEGGSNLSAGQKQLLCLSRALLKKSKILILDEATAAVDMDTDRLVQDTIKTAFRDHTVITIAHRLNTVMDYDKIVVMDAGKIAEVGSPESLLQIKESQFYHLAKEAGLV